MQTLRALQTICKLFASKRLISLSVVWLVTTPICWNDRRGIGVRPSRIIPYISPIVTGLINNNYYSHSYRAVIDQFHIFIPLLRRAGQRRRVFGADDDTDYDTRGSKGDFQASQNANRYYTCESRWFGKVKAALEHAQALNLWPWPARNRHGAQTRRPDFESSTGTRGPISVSYTHLRAHET